MPVSNDLMLAILAMDAYNQGYDPGLASIGKQIGNAFVNKDSTEVPSTSSGQSVGFYAIAYDWNGQKVIAYRGTDFETILQDVWYGWTSGGGLIVPGSQSFFARDFYTAVTGKRLSDGPAANTILTGHSLGGGLAGLIAALTGTRATVFDHEPYAATAAVAALVGDQRFITSLGNISALHVSGEALELIRAAAPGLAATLYSDLQPQFGATLLSAFTALTATQNDLEPLSTYGFGGLLSNPVQLHSQSLLVLLQYAKERELIDWHSVAAEILGATYDNKIATAAGMPPAHQGGQYGPSDKLRAMIAYSAIDSGVKPFGDAAIRAMFDDADELGRLVDDGRASKTLQKLLPSIIVQFAGQMVQQKVEAANHADLAPEKGIILYSKEGALISDAAQADTVGVDLNRRLWNLTDDPTQGDISGRRVKVEGVVAALNEYFQPVQAAAETSVDGGRPGAADSRINAWRMAA